MNNPLPDRPYVGLIPFLEQDAEFFFGREQEKEIITSNLVASRLTLIYGASGVGKSSVLNAGVAHHLRLLAERDLKRERMPKFTVVVFSSWRDEPISSLLSHVEAAVRKTLAGRRVEPVSEGLSFVDSLREWARRVQGQLLIILDQFEEYFLYHPNEDGDGTFGVEFPRAVNTAGLPVNFIVSYREDAHAQLDFFKGRIPNLYDNYLRIGHLTYPAAYAAIKNPISRYNQLHKLTGNEQYDIEEDLVAEVLNQVKAGEKFIGEAGKGVVAANNEDKNQWEIETPYLQLVMTRLWDTEVKSGSRLLRKQTLHDLGGARTIVQTHLDHAMSGFSRKERLMGANIFNYLVTPSGTKIAQTAHDLADYAKLSLHQEQQLDDMMEKLTAGDHRILRSVPPPAHQPNARRYEVFHDVLAQAILDWRKRFDARKARLRYLKVFAVMAIIILFMGAATVYAWRQRAIATRAAAEADEQRTIAVRQSEIASQSQKHAEDSERRAKRSLEVAKAALISEETAKREAEQNARRAEQAAAAAREAAIRVAKAAKEEQEAKVKAVEALQVAKEEKEKAEKAASEATAQRLKAEEALNTVNEIDRSNAYYQEVIRVKDQVDAAFFNPHTQAKLILSGGRALIPNLNSVAIPLPQTDCEPPACIVRDAQFNPAGDKIIVTYSGGGDLDGVAVIRKVTPGQSVVGEQLDQLVIAGNETLDKTMLFGGNFVKSNKVIAFGSNVYKTCLWNEQLNRLENCVTKEISIPGRTTIIKALAPYGQHFLVTDANELYLFRIETGNLIKVQSSSSIDSEAAFSPNEREFALSDGNFVRLIDMNTGHLITSFETAGAVTAIAFSRDGKKILAADVTGVANIWNLETRKMISKHAEHRGPIVDGAF